MYVEQRKSSCVHDAYVYLQSCRERDVCARMRPQVNGDFKGTPRFAVYVLSSLARVAHVSARAHLLYVWLASAVPSVCIVVFSSLQIRDGDEMAASVENYEPGK